MAQEYTGEVVQEPVQAKPYTGEVIPLAARQSPGRAQLRPRGEEKKAAAAKRPESGDAEFVTGNLNKGIANLAGLPVDTARNVINLGIAGYGGLKGAMGGRDLPELLKPGYGSSQHFEDLMRRGGAITPGAEPESDVGRYAASALQMVPGALVGRGTVSQLPGRAIAGATSGVGAQAATDIGGEEYSGVGAMLPGAGRLAHHETAGERATAERRGENVGKARELGIPIPPSVGAPSHLKNILEGLVGKSKLEKTIAPKSQQAIQDAVNKELRMPPGTPLTGETLQQLRNAHWADYQAIINEPALQGQVQATPTFRKAIKDLALEERKLRAEFPNSVKDVGLQEVLSDFTKPAFTAEGAMAQVKRLREGASNNLGSPSATDDQRRLGLIQRRIANAMENMIEENVARIGKPELMQRFRQARQTIAQSHDVESALDPVTRQVSGPKLSALLTEGQPLSGQLRKIAEVSGAFPQAVKDPAKAGQPTEGMAPSGFWHPFAEAAHIGTGFMRPIMTHPLYQRMFADPRNRLTPEQERQLRFLSAAQASNRSQGDIPPPPQ